MEKKGHNREQERQNGVGRPVHRPGRPGGHGHGPGGPGGSGGGEKAKDFAGTWKKLLHYCRKYLAVMVIAVVCAVAGTVLTLIGPDKLSEMTDLITEGILGGIDMDAVAGIGMTLVSFYVAGYILSAVQGWIMATVTQRVSRNLRSDISKKINRLPMWFYNRTTTGDVLSRVTNDVDTIGQSLNQSIGNLISAIVLFIGSLVMMFKTNGIMTLTAVLSTMIGFVVMFAIMGRSQRYFIRQQENLGALNGHIEEIYAGHTVIKAYNGEEKAQETFDHLNDKLRDSGFKAQCLSGLMMPIMTFIGNFGYVAVCVVGGALALKGSIRFGVIVAFIMYVRYFTQPLSQIAQAMQSLQSAAAAGERVFAFLEAEEMEDESSKVQQLKQTKGYVEFEHVKFGYEDSDRTIIHDFSAEAKPGQKIAIVGPTGAGKTTMVNLLMRFHEIQEGAIRIDGVSTKEMSRQEVHSQFCMVLQDTWLFEGTVRENLIYCTEGATEETMRNACRAVGLDHFIRTLPKGYDTVLNDQVNLSQGQKQQITIARAMIADKPMLILDEATSSVDTRTELQIQEAMDALMKNRTSFVIAHRLSTIKNSDLILVMRDGDIIEKGTHDELLKKGGFYAELYNSQFEQAS
ncbi:MAG: ABC transporter ATP-binding protein [Lachnospiraceae bacterium]|nr:ABC transporter ATP-binding protein [Lachnospiraceae bacterium]